MTVSHDEDVIVIEKNDVYEVDSDKYFFLSKEAKARKNKSCEYEEAIEKVGFGKFNLFLYIIAIATGLATVFDGVAMSYIMSDVRCDLGLTLTQEGILNAVTLAGMVTTGLFWGYISDTIGRRKLLVHILFLDFIFSLFAALSRNFIVLVVFNFLAGTVRKVIHTFFRPVECILASVFTCQCGIPNEAPQPPGYFCFEVPHIHKGTSGVYAALASYLTELHRNKHRVVVQLFIGFIYGFAELLLPLLAMALLTENKSYVIFDDYDYRPWNLFLLICCLAPFLSAVGFMLLPESPKFLMSVGKNEEALDALRRLYNINHSFTSVPYPVVTLQYAVASESQYLLGSRKYENLVCEACHQFLTQLRLVCSSEYLFNMVSVSMIQFAIILGLDAYKLWMPVLFHEIVTQEASGESPAVCDALAHFYTKNSSDVCDKTPQLYKEYLYCAIVAAVTLLVFILSSTVVNGLGKKQLLFFLGYNAGLAAIVASYSQDIPTTVALSAIVVPFQNIAFNALISIVIVIFPTNLRSMSVAITMSVGRLGGAVGCFVFPVLLELGCAAPLVFLGCLMIAWSLLVSILPNTESMILE